MDKLKIAKIISTITNPPILCIPLFLIISITLSFTHNGFDFYKFIYLELISIIFTSILPTAIILHWAHKVGSDNDISNRTDRFTPLIVGVVSYFIGFLISLLTSIDNFLTVLLLCYSINTFIVLLITFKWKISIHTTGLSGPVGALILLLGQYGALFGIIYPILIWSRVLLKKHTLAQAITGGVNGFLLTVLEIYFFNTYFNLNIINLISLNDSLLFILSIVITPVIFGILNYINIKNKRKTFILTEIIILLLFTTFSNINTLVIFTLVTLTSILIGHFEFSDSNF